MSKDVEESLAYGGQALIEGVMMRSDDTMVMCVRQPDQEIATFSQYIDMVSKRNRVLGLPFIRGIAMLVETMYYGVKAMMQSANVALEEEDEEFTLFDYVILVAMVLLLNGLFIAIPFILTNYIGLTGILFNVVESLIRLGLFMAYLFVISLWGEVARVLQYHGAEHKAINAYEAGRKRGNRIIQYIGYVFFGVIGTYIPYMNDAEHLLNHGAYGTLRPYLLANVLYVFGLGYLAYRAADTNGKRIKAVIVLAAVFLLVHLLFYAPRFPEFYWS